MKTLGRRSMLVATLAAGGASATGAFFALGDGRQAILRVLSAEFGAEIGESDAAAAFAADFVAKRLEPATVYSGMKHMALAALPNAGLELTAHRDQFRQWVIGEFVMSTTAIRAYEAGNSLVYFGLDAAHERPCTNPLSAAWR